MAHRVGAKAIFSFHQAYASNVMCQRAIWNCPKSIGKWTPSNGGDKNLHRSLSNSLPTEIFRMKSKSSPTEFQTEFSANRILRRSFLSPRCGRRCLEPKTKKHGGHKNGVFYVTPKTTEVTKMAATVFLRRFHQVVTHAKISIFTRGRSET